MRIEDGTSEIEVFPRSRESPPSLVPSLDHYELHDAVLGLLSTSITSMCNSRTILVVFTLDETYHQLLTLLHNALNSGPLLLHAVVL